MSTRNNIPQEGPQYDEPLYEETMRMFNKYDREIKELNMAVHSRYLKQMFTQYGNGAHSRYEMFGGKDVFSRILQSGNCKDYGDENVNDTIKLRSTELYISIARDSSVEVADAVMKKMSYFSFSFPGNVLEEGFKIFQKLQAAGFDMNAEDAEYQEKFLQDIRLWVIEKLMSSSDASVQNLQSTVHQEVNDARG